MRVGLDLTALGAGAGGVGRYADELVGALAARGDVELTVFGARRERAWLHGRRWSSDVRAVLVPTPPPGSPLALAMTHATVPALALAHRLDVLHGPANVAATGLPRAGCVVTLHDLIWLRLGERWGPAAAVQALRRQAGRAARRADRVVCVSHDAAADVIAGLRAPADRVVAVPSGVRAPAPATPTTPADVLRTGLGIPPDAPVLLCVAQKRPYKRQDLLVAALADPRLAHVHLVLPGAPTPFEDELVRLAGERGVAPRVHTPGYVPDADLEGLYALATAVALPSEHEGFGLPVLEAMVRGVPVACSDRGALTEVAGDAADVLDLDAPEQVAEVLARLVADEDHRAELVRRGRERAAAFSWERTAQATVEAYAAAAARARGGRRG